LYTTGNVEKHQIGSCLTSGAFKFIQFAEGICACPFRNYGVWICSLLDLTTKSMVVIIGMCC